MLPLIEVALFQGTMYISLVAPVTAPLILSFRDDFMAGCLSTKAQTTCGPCRSAFSVKVSQWVSAASPHGPAPAEESCPAKTTMDGHVCPLPVTDPHGDAGLAFSLIWDQLWRIIPSLEALVGLAQASLETVS